MKCLFCGGDLVDMTSKMNICIYKNCEFSFYWYDFFLCYYVCVNRRIAIADWGWGYIIRKNFFSRGSFISYRSSRHKEFEFDYRLFIEKGFVF